MYFDAEIVYGGHFLAILHHLRERFGAGSKEVGAGSKEVGATSFDPAPTSFDPAPTASDPAPSWRQDEQRRCQDGQSSS